MDCPAKLLFVQLFLNGPNLSQGGGGTAGHLPDAKDAIGPNFESGGIWILQVGGRPELPPKGAFNDRLERGFPTGSNDLGLHQKVIGKNQGRFHNMAKRMVVRLGVNLPTLFPPFCPLRPPRE